MDRYLITLPHTAEDCMSAIKQVETIGTITHFDWGCKDNEHTGWVIIEAENKSQALMVVPPIQRHRAVTVKLTRFSPEEIQAMHHA